MRRAGRRRPQPRSEPDGSRCASTACGARAARSFWSRCAARRRVRRRGLVPASLARITTTPSSSTSRRSLERASILGYRPSPPARPGRGRAHRDVIDIFLRFFVEPRDQHVDDVALACSILWPAFAAGDSPARAFSAWSCSWARWRSSFCSTRGGPFLSGAFQSGARPSGDHGHARRARNVDRVALLRLGGDHRFGAGPTSRPPPRSRSSCCWGGGSRALGPRLVGASRVEPAGGSPARRVWFLPSTMVWT